MLRLLGLIVKRGEGGDEPLGAVRGEGRVVWVASIELSGPTDEKEGHMRKTKGSRRILVCLSGEARTRAGCEQWQQRAKGHHPEARRPSREQGRVKTHVIVELAKAYPPHGTLPRFAMPKIAGGGGICRV